jgi:mono/diheme cytochrome c family protein
MAQFFRWILALGFGWLALLSGCVRTPDYVDRLPLPPVSRVQASASLAAAQRVLEQRCVVCHGCYDAPCQLKLDSYAGLARGGSEQRVYDGARLAAMTPTRLDIDAHDVASWRERGFHAVLPEGDSRREPRESVLLRMLDLKRANPLPEVQDLRKDFTFDIDRKQSCTDSEHFDSYANAHPLWGMPYGLPALSDEEWTAVNSWVQKGAPYIEPPELSRVIKHSIEQWESFLNQTALKSRLMSRYIYEHLFLASLYFKDLDDTQFFRLVRSRTPPVLWSMRSRPADRSMIPQPIISTIASFVAWDRRWPRPIWCMRSMRSGCHFTARCSLPQAMRSRSCRRMSRRWRPIPFALLRPFRFARVIASC